MYWIISNNIKNERFYDDLLSFLKRFNIPYETNKSIPFTGEFLTEPNVPDGMNVMVIGTYSMAEEAKKRGWVPGTFMNDNYDYRVWSKEWNSYCLNQPATVHKFSEVPKQEGFFFIRPCEDTKLFTGQVMEWDEFSEWQGKVIDLKETYTELDGDSMILVSEARKIYEEYRFIIVDGKVITGSLYKSGDAPMQKECTDPEVIGYAQFIADIWCPERAFALDICKADGKYYVLEMGCMNAAGLYHCDIQKIVMAIEDMEF